MKLLRDYYIVKDYDIDFQFRPGSTSDFNLLLKEFYINLRQQTVLLAVKYSAELNNYVLLVSVIFEYLFREQETSPRRLSLPFLSTVIIANNPH